MADPKRCKSDLPAKVLRVAPGSTAKQTCGVQRFEELAALTRLDQVAAASPTGALFLLGVVFSSLLIPLL